MTRLYVYSLLTALVFASSAAVETEKTVDDLLGMIQTLQKGIATLKCDNQKAQERTKIEMNQLRDDNLALNTKVTGLEKWMNDRQMDVNSTFFATITARSVPVDSGDAIVFDSAPINPAGHFNTLLGAYTAPTNGYYQFSVTKEGNNYSGNFFLLVDEVRYVFKQAWFPNSNTDPQGSATINIELSAGQIVRVENGGADTVYGTDETGFFRTWFTGHLLYAL